MTLISKVGGASGPLYGTFFLQFGTTAGDATELSPEAWADCFDAAVAGVKARGKAEPGDKTMLDALLPAGEALRAALGEGAGLGAALARAASAADEGIDRHDPARGAEGPGELPRRAQRRAPGPRCHIERDPRRVRSAHVGRRHLSLTG